MRPSSVRFALAVGALSLSCAHGGVGSTAGWSRVESRHFTVYAQTARDTQLVVNSLELAHSAIGGTFFKKVAMPRVDVLVLTHESFGELMGFRRDTVALARAPAGKIGQSGLIISRDDRGRPNTGEAVTHLLIAQAFPRAPLWFHEGFAGYARRVAYREGGGGQIACFGLPSGDKQPLVPLDRLVTIGWDDYDGDEARSWYKHTAEMMIDFILHGAGGRNKARMLPLVEAVDAGKSGRQVLDAAFPNVSLAVLNDKLKEHAADVAAQMASGSPQRGLCPLPAPISADRAVDETPPHVTPASPADLDVLLAGLLKLPRRDGYPPWYPPEVVARVK